MTIPKDERRSRNRIPARLPVKVATAGQAGPATGFTRDLSLNGVFLYTSQEIRPGGKLELVLILPPELTDGEQCWVCCQASVVRVEEAPAGGQIGVAAAIHSLAKLPEIPR